MAILRRRTSPTLADMVTAANNEVARVGAGAHFHLDPCEETVTAATATDLATSITLVNQLKAVYNFHCADSLALKAVDATVVTTANATDLASAETLINDIKAKYNVHRASATIHYNADATNTLATADATDLASLEALANAAETAINAHIADAPSAKSCMVRLVSA